MSEAYAAAYQPDRSLKGKLRRRLVRLASRRPMARAPGRPMLTIAFDDAPLSAAREGAQILETFGVKGVFYVSGGLAGATGPMGDYAAAADYRRLADAGHEIGCHTFSHLDCGKAAGSESLGDVARNAAWLAEAALPAAATFAYPYGDVAPGPKRALAPRYALLRGLHHGLIEKGCDLNQAPAVGIEGPEGEAQAMAWLDRAWLRKAWLILYTHDVAEAASPWGCTPGALARVLGRAKELDFDVVTAAEGAARLSGPRPADRG